MFDMLCETEGEFTFAWNIEMCKLLSLKHTETIKSPIVEAEKLKKTKWYLSLFSGQDGLVCSLNRHGSDESENIFITVAYKLEIVDSDGKILKSDVRNKREYSKGSSHDIRKFITQDTLELLKKNGKISATDTFTVRCHIIDESYKKLAMKRDLPSAIQTQWQIKTPGLSDWSKNIKVPLHDYTHIDISMYASNSRIDIQIGKVDLLQPYNLKILVLNDEGVETDFKHSRNLFQSTDKNETFETWIEKSQLVDKSCFHLSYSFTLICIISIANENVVTEIESYSFGDRINESFSSTTASLLPLQEDLKKLLLDEKHSDVKLRAHDKIIPAHKCLLSVRSPVFAAMFDQDMLETQTGIVDIPDVESETLRSFSEFLYTDRIINTDYDRVLKLMLVADKYQVDVLKEKCSKILMSVLSMENVCEVVSVADMVNQPNLKLFAINFIKENKKEIVSSLVWSDWMEKNMKLANEILLKLIID